MEAKNKKLGIIAGGGTLPRSLIEHCRKTGRDFFVIAVEGNADPALFTENVPHMWIRIGQAGSGFKRFRDEKVEEVVMIGTIRRPSFKELIPDMRTTAFFAKIGAKALGDDGILRALIKEIESENMRVVGIHEVMSNILVKSGVLGKVKPGKEDLIDIRRGVQTAFELGKLDIGQSVVVQQGLVLGVEAIEGTDELIKRCGGYKRKGSGGVLVKLRKPRQDMRIDLPTIGARTVENAKASGLNGLAVHAGNTLIVDVRDYTDFALLGATRDDAAGECFDKAARVLGLPYPGGAAMDKLAHESEGGVYELPRAKIDGCPLDMSFSGLKTAVVNLAHNAEQTGKQLDRAALARDFTQAVVDELVPRAMLAMQQSGRKVLVAAGGVAANSFIRAELEKECRKHGYRLYMPPLKLCGDNGAMIGAQGYYEYLAGARADWALNAYATRDIDDPIV